MSACLVLDDALTALTSRLLLLMEDEKEMLLIQPQQQRSLTTALPPRILEETKEPDESFLLVSPNHKTSSLQGPRFDSIPELALPNMKAYPKTPLSTTKGLFASFPSSPMPQDLWQYEEPQTSSFLSPRTTDAVFLDTKRAANANTAATAEWNPMQSSSKNAATTNNNNNGLPMAPTLNPNGDGVSPNYYKQGNAPPSIIRCRARSGSYSSLNGFDDDEVSLLADDPDEDDAGVLPPSTYNVVVNILDQIDRDD